MKTIKRKKVIIKKIRIEEEEAIRQFEIRLPLNAEKITSITVTASLEQEILNG